MFVLEQGVDCSGNLTLILALPPLQKFILAYHAAPYVKRFGLSMGLGQWLTLRQELL